MFLLVKDTQERYPVIASPSNFRKKWRWKFLIKNTSRNLGNWKELGLRLWPRHKYLTWQTYVHSKVVSCSLWRRISDFTCTVLPSQDGGKERVLIKKRIPSAHAWRIWNATWPICHTFRAPPPFAFKSHSLRWFAAATNYRSHLLHLQKNTIWNKNVGGSILTLFFEGESIACAGATPKWLILYCIHVLLCSYRFSAWEGKRKVLLPPKNESPSFPNQARDHICLFFSRDHWYARAQYQHSAWERKRSF